MCKSAETDKAEPVPIPNLPLEFMKLVLGSHALTAVSYVKNAPDVVVDGNAAGADRDLQYMPAALHSRISPSIIVALSIYVSDKFSNVLAGMVLGVQLLEEES